MYLLSASYLKIMVETSKNEPIHILQIWSVYGIGWVLCDSCVTVFYTNGLINEFSGHHYALDWSTHSDLSITYVQRDVFTG